MPDDLPIQKDIYSKFNKRFSTKSNLFYFKLPQQYRRILAQLAIEKKIGITEVLKEAVALYMKEVHGFGQSKGPRP